MKSLPIRQAERLLLSAAAGSEETEVAMYTAKKDRSLTVRVTGGTVTIAEKGYERQETSFPSEERSAAKKALKEAIDREFPRSHRVYVN